MTPLDNEGRVDYVARHVGEVYWVLKRLCVYLLLVLYSLSSAVTAHRTAAPFPIAAYPLWRVRVTRGYACPYPYPYLCDPYPHTRRVSHTRGGTLGQMQRKSRPVWSRSFLKRKKDRTGPDFESLRLPLPMCVR